MDSSIINQITKAYGGFPAETVEKRFWRRVDKYGDNGCWNWTGGLSSSKYGSITIDRQVYKTHRISWLIHFGNIPEENDVGYHGVCVCHHCDNPKCVNPSHLFLGLHKENMEDRNRKGRSGCLVGESHTNSKLTEKQVRLIRYWWGLENVTQTRMARFFNVSPGLISGIVNCRSWRHI